MFRLQIRSWPLRGHPRLLGDFWSQSTLMIHRRTPGARVYSIHRAPGCSVCLSGPMMGHFHANRISEKEGPLFHSLISQPLACAFLMLPHAGLGKCACTHMSEKTCAQDVEVHKATYAHKTSTSTHTGTRVATRLPPRGICPVQYCSLTFQSPCLYLPHLLYSSANPSCAYLG